jgi:Na+/H+ antiporter NhaD/arsenite permease-like protein
VILFPFQIPIFIPLPIWKAFLWLLSALRIIPPPKSDPNVDRSGYRQYFKKLSFPVNFMTAPLAADLFLLAILAIGRNEVEEGTIGANHIVPYDIMLFFLSLAYIAISVDASGLIRWLAYKVLQRAGDVGHRLFFYLYAFFFGLGSFIGNDPIILSGTAFLAYMTRVSQNIEQPTAWIHTQFAIANIASAILVSSNPTNLVLAGAFNIKFLHYTANIIVPVIFTVIILFPFLMYIVFNDETLIPSSIKLHELSDEAKARLAEKPVNPNIPNARGTAEEKENAANSEEGQVLSLEEILHPFLDKGGAAFSAVIMACTLIAILALNAAAQNSGEYPVFWVTLPAAVVSFGYDVASGWMSRKKTRRIACKGQEDVEKARAYAIVQKELCISSDLSEPSDLGIEPKHMDDETASELGLSSLRSQPPNTGKNQISEFERRVKEVLTEMRKPEPKTLVSLMRHSWRWCQETFPTASAVLTHLPFALIPFAFCMFILVQALVTKGWVPVFAHGWDHWVNKTGTVGSIAGMGFLSTVLCSVSLLFSGAKFMD